MYRWAPTVRIGGSSSDPREEPTMAVTEVPQTTKPRLNAIVDDIHQALVEIITRHRVTLDEYRTAVGWLAEAGQQHLEIPLMMDVFLASTLDDLAHTAGDGTASNVEGPFHLPGAPRLERPYVLPMRENEPGEKLFFSGTVRSTDGSPLAGANLDIWQANGACEYSHFNPGVPEYNLRGQLTTDDDGAFEFETVVPAAYEVPKAGATGQLLSALGRHCFRPGHIHFKLSHPDAAPLTTQIYFEGDPWLDSDVVGAVKASLVTKLGRHDADASGLYATCSYDFVLPRSAD
jgi:catechol 1,2-dioxygenase